MSVDRFRYAVAHEYRYVLLNKFLIPSKWYFICLTFDTKMATFFLDGEIIDIYQIQLEERPVGRRIMVGYVFPSPHEGITYIGNITQVNVWQKKLTSEAIRGMWKCHNDLEGDVVKWTATSWADQDAARHRVQLYSLCQTKISSKSIEVFPPMIYDEATYICEGFGGELATPATLSQVEILYGIVEKENPECSVLWAGFWDEKIEGKWVHHLNGKEAIDIPWAPNEPNGIHFENCAGMDKEGIVDADCNSKR